MILDTFCGLTKTSSENKTRQGCRRFRTSDPTHAWRVAIRKARQKVPPRAGQPAFVDSGRWSIFIRSRWISLSMRFGVIFVEVFFFHFKKSTKALFFSIFQHCHQSFLAEKLLHRKDQGPKRFVAATSWTHRKVQSNRWTVLDVTWRRHLKMVGILSQASLRFVGKKYKHHQIIYMLGDVFFFLQACETLEASIFCATPFFEGGEQGQTQSFFFFFLHWRATKKIRHLKSVDIFKKSATLMLLIVLLVDTCSASNNFWKTSDEQNQAKRQIFFFFWMFGSSCLDRSDFGLPSDPHVAIFSQGSEWIWLGSSGAMVSHLVILWAIYIRKSQGFVQKYHNLFLKKS